MMPSQIPKAGWIELFLWLIRQRRRCRIVGNSMMPLLKSGDDVLVRPVRAEKILSGDLILARHPIQGDLQIIKKVERILEDGQLFLTGLNPEESTDSHSYGPVAPERVLGKVTSRL